MASQEMSLKLLVDVKGSRVLFAEVPKEFVDFLFHIFSLPLGTLVELIGSNQMAGCLGKLKGSIESFNGNYLQPGIKMDDIFNPKTAFNGKTFLLSCDASSGDQSGASKAVYRCAKAAGYCHYCGNQPCRSNATLDANSICPNCSGCMNYKMALVTPPKEVAETKLADEIKKRGYVKEVVTYMVMDDLVVNPMSTISGITLINKFGVKDLSQLEEKTVSFGKDEGLKLLEASLKTNKVLTTVFMH
ncbi:hypothetical protein HanXRQr2_Chr08g0332221 [Helianthus annuus]|uniref:DUF674 domain-containing protein n=2 Tax=Helianthus annuus TaxID=4232 RepID=A0A251U4A3_HELAN|nr:uncharacterized protein LOC110872546 isoform X2 [Helianthus annuus]XP_021977052.1 uncharacterized protein LOC110872546 isoform X2 [Helianthus annuus]KAF5794802.1 hypothetical protein HanXRQr2_Chr08g0332221 [Helianthus annuus]